jgi:hypothetical protein
VSSTSAPYTYLHADQPITTEPNPHLRQIVETINSSQLPVQETPVHETPQKLLQRVYCRSITLKRYPFCLQEDVDEVGCFYKSRQRG